MGKKTKKKNVPELKWKINRLKIGKKILRKKCMFIVHVSLCVGVLEKSIIG